MSDCLSNLTGRSAADVLGPGRPNGRVLAVLLQPMLAHTEVAKLERYDAYRNAPASGRGNAARAPRSHWQETYAGPSLERPFPPVLFVFAPAPRRAAPATREAAFHERARRVGSVNYRLTVATTTLPRLTREGADGRVWRVVGNSHGEERRALAALPKAR
ncbi:hypothetical protein [Streptomyces sp. NPDC090131]|uniref:hypothetical protein n=1 Tax=Streptomyces sp. NPDC090131 TaxID=3365954 RepID=UPI0037F76328